MHHVPAATILPRDNKQMRDSDQTTRRLQTCDSAVWEAFLSHRLDVADLRVTHVSAEQIERQRTRYVIQLAGHSDPITLLGKRTTPLEARFYRHFADRLPAIAPRCWFSSADSQSGWVVIDDVPNDRPPADWQGGDAEDVITQLARLHVTFWDQGAALDQHEWLPQMTGTQETWLQTQRRKWLQDQAHFYDRRALASAHAIETVGTLAPTLVDAVAGLKAMQMMGGWPDVLDERHLNAAADLLDDPVPIFQPLRTLPATLLHGYPGIYNWRVSLFGERHLVDWRQAVAGPAVSDLIVFLETFNALGFMDDGQSPSITEETLIDSYILQLSAELSARDDITFDARAVRQAIPAARCLYILFHWFPRFEKWFHWSPEQLFAGQQVDPFEQEDISTRPPTRLHNSSPTSRAHSSASSPPTTNSRTR